MWISSGASGSSEDDGDDGVRDWQLFQQPDNEVPVPVPLHLVLARTSDLAVVVDGAQVYSRGFAFALTVLARQDPGHGHDLFQQISGHAPDGERLLFGIEFADGRRAANTSEMLPRPQSATGGGVSLVAQGGGGGGRRFRQDFWVTTLPPAGPLRFVVRWDAQQVEEAVVETDGSLLGTAAQWVEELWPWEPERPGAWEPELPVLPADGWFAQLRDEPRGG